MLENLSPVKYVPPTLEVQRARALNQSRHASATDLFAPPVNVIIPIGGIGSRFSKLGYRYPKPLISIAGRPMLFHLLDHLTMRPQDKLFIAIKESVDQEFQLISQVRDEYPDIDLRVIHLKYDTRGAAETLYIVTQSMEDFELENRTVSLDCDTIYFKDVLASVRALPANTSATVHFFDDGDKPVYSYIKLDSKNRIVEIKEKKPITRQANTGAYIFASAQLLKENATVLLDAKNALSDVGEYYISSVISSMISVGNAFLGIPIEKREFYCVGTPDQLESFLIYIDEHPELVKKRRFCFDLDSTLVSRPLVRGDYSSVEPIMKNIELVRELKRAGHYIIIQTARRMRTHNGNVGAVLKDIAGVTFASLEKFNIPYDEIHFGKPWAHVYVDDLAVNALLDTRKELGWKYDQQGDLKAPEKNGMIASRSFNVVQIFETNVIKSSKDLPIVGEMFYYANMPDDIKHLFAEMLGMDYLSENYSLTMSKVNGVTFSHLLGNRGLTIGRLQKLLDTLGAIHKSCGICSKPYNLQSLLPKLSVIPSKLPKSEIYANYAAKVEARFTSHKDMYRSLAPEASMVYEQLHSKLVEFEKGDCGIFANAIHGDPVFSNAVLTLDGSVRFLDMRGCVGKRYTTAGDVCYDLAKCYQSLRGYDLIILKGEESKPENLSQVLDHLDKRMLTEFEVVFWDHVGKAYPAVKKAHIQWITASLLFSLIPLHEHKNRPLFYEMMKLLIAEIQE